MINFLGNKKNEIVQTKIGHVLAPKTLKNLIFLIYIQNKNNKQITNFDLYTQIIHKRSHIH